uniref:Replication protein A 70 kDa DNA-binding subunit-like n=1 Tax=Phallusia mammillata TaxID=59560 RepID=A0A6F9DRP7_9ASCI|nr:replication protein A 70 kDa DNA-binding subunit-like [Phallusia mammillata]
MAYQLSQGTLMKIVKEEKPNHPILQCLRANREFLSRIARITLVLSDGVHSFGACVLAEEQNDLVMKGQLQQHTLLRLKEYRVILYKGSKFVICDDVELLATAEETGGRIGNPARLKQPDSYCAFHFLTGNEEHTKLTGGAVMELMCGKQPYQPILQCLGTTCISDTGVRRYRLVVSDGIHSFDTVMIASQLNEMVDVGSLQRYTVFQAMQYHSAVIEGNVRIVILLDVEEIEWWMEAGAPIGEPVPFGVAQKAADVNKGLPSASKLENENSNPSGTISSRHQTSKKSGNQQKIYIMPPQNRVEHDQTKAHLYCGASG